MDIGRFFRSLAPLAAMAASLAVAACDDANIDINGEKGKPLAELDTSGPAPHGVALFGPDTVQITPGDKLAIKVDGPADEAAQLRFTLKDGTLGIIRRHADGNSGKLTIHVTMPAPSELVMLGSGSINAAAIAGDAQVNIGGSGDVATPNAGPGKLSVNIGGSGLYRAGGHVSKLELNIGGSGTADLAALSADKAEINIAGSGNSSFASDGNVTANIIGSGRVTVKGRAHCTVNAVGSGKLICEPGDGQGVQTATSKDGSDSDDDKPDSAGKSDDDN